MAVIVDGIDLEKDCKGCISCVFRWSGDSCTYCIAQGSHEYDNRIHKIDYTEWEKISKECKDADERYHKQMIWKEPTCPLKEVPSDDYKRGWTDAITLALKETHNYYTEDGVFKAIQEESLIGIGMVVEEHQGEDIKR